MNSYLSGNRPADAPLTGFLADAGQDEGVLVAGTAPSITVQSKEFSGTVWSMPLKAYQGDGSFVGTSKIVRAPGAKFPRPFNDFVPTETAYKCEEHSLADFIDVVTAARFKGVPYGAERFKAVTLRRTLVLDYEACVIGNAVFNTSNWSNVAIGALGGNSAQLAWTNIASTPKRDGRRLRNLIRTATGGTFPDYGYITYAAVEACTVHPDFTGHSGTYSAGLSPGKSYTTPEDVIAQMKIAWNLSELHVVQAMYNSANPGQTASVAEVEAGGQLWLGCKRGMAGATGSAQGMSGGAMLGNGPVSFLVVKENLAAAIPGFEAVQPGSFAGLTWMSDDPPGTNVAAGHSFGIVRPTDMSGTAYLLTGLT